MDPTRILYIYQEIVPYTPETIAAKFCRELPQFIQENDGARYEYLLLAMVSSMSGEISCTRYNDYRDSIW